METALLKTVAWLAAGGGSWGLVKLAIKFLELWYKERELKRAADHAHAITADEHQQRVYADLIARLEHDTVRIAGELAAALVRETELRADLARTHTEYGEALEAHEAAIEAKARAEAALHDALTDAGNVREITRAKVALAVERLAEANLRASQAEAREAELSQALEDLQRQFQRALAECERERALGRDDLATAVATIERLKTEIRRLGGAPHLSLTGGPDDDKT